MVNGCTWCRIDCIVQTTTRIRIKHSRIGIDQCILDANLDDILHLARCPYPPGRFHADPINRHCPFGRVHRRKLGTWCRQSRMVGRRETEINAGESRWIFGKYQRPITWKRKEMGQDASYGEQAMGIRDGSTEGWDGRYRGHQRNCKDCGHV